MQQWDTTTESLNSFIPDGSECYTKCRGQDSIGKVKKSRRVPGGGGGASTRRGPMEGPLEDVPELAGDPSTASQGICRYRGSKVRSDQGLHEEGQLRMLGAK